MVRVVDRKRAEAVSSGNHVLDSIRRRIVDGRIGLVIAAILLVLSGTWLLPLMVTGRTEMRILAFPSDWLLSAVYAVAALATASSAIRLLRARRGRDWDAFLSQRIDDRHVCACSLSECQASLERHGFIDDAPVDGRVHLTRNAAGSLGGAVIRFGIALLLAASVVHVWTSSSASIEMAEGQSVAQSLVAAGYLDDAVRPYLPAQDLVLKTMDPRFRGSGYEVKRIAASFSDRGVVKKFASGRPLWIDPFTTVSVLDFDMAPQFIVHAEDGSLSEDTVRPLDLLPPGEDQTLELDSAKARINMRLSIDEQDAASTSGAEFGLKDARFVMTAISRVAGVPERVVIRQVVGVGDEVNINDFNVRLESVKSSGTFRVTHSLAMPLVIAGLIAALVGLFALLFFRRIDVLLVKSGDHVAYAAYDYLFGYRGGVLAVEKMLGADGQPA